MLESEANSIVATRREQAMTLIPALKRRAKFITTLRVGVINCECSRDGAALSFVSYPGTVYRVITERRLFGYCCFQLSIVFLHYVERLFLLSPVGDQSLSVVEVLD